MVQRLPDGKLSIDVAVANITFFCESREAKSLPVMNPEHGVKCRDRRKAHMSSEGAKSTNPVVDIVMNALTRKIV